MTELTETKARTELELKLQPGAHPCLDQSEMGELVAAAVACQNLPLVVVHGWLMKAAKVAGMPDIKVGSNAVSNSQVHANCMEQARVAADIAGVSLPGPGQAVEGKGIATIGTYRTDQNFYGPEHHSNHSHGSWF